MKIGIIGFGNLGSSLTEGLIASGAVSAKDIFVCDNSAETREAASEKYGVSVSGDINFVIGQSDAVFLVVKGYVFEEIAPGIDKSVLTGKIIISFMAGVTFEKIRGLIGDDVQLIRAMPSLAVSNCDGVIAYTAAPEEISQIFHGLGYAFEVKPEDIEKVMAFASCGLGFAAYLVGAFAEAGEKLGFSPEECEKIAAQTFQNAIDRGNFSKTVSAVAVSGGATEQGVLHMDACNVRDAVVAAVQKAYDKMK